MNRTKIREWKQQPAQGLKTNERYVESNEQWRRERKKEWPDSSNFGAQEGMTEGRRGAAISTESAAGRSVAPLQLRPPCLVCSLVSSPGRIDAGKCDPVVELGEKCTGKGGLVCERRVRE